jgi:hypothetical protein
MRTFLINLLFRLLGSPSHQLYNVQYLFGVSTSSHEQRKKKWEKALARVYKDKDLLDYLYYQAEADKENVFQGKVNKDLSRGARIRTLFIVYSAHMAYRNMLKGKQSNADEQEDSDKELKQTRKSYKTLTDVENKA